MMAVSSGARLTTEVRRASTNASALPKEIVTAKRLHVDQHGESYSRYIRGYIGYWYWYA